MKKKPWEPSLIPLFLIPISIWLLLVKQGILIICLMWFCYAIYKVFSIIKYCNETEKDKKEFITGEKKYTTQELIDKFGKEHLFELNKNRLINLEEEKAKHPRKYRIIEPRKWCVEQLRKQEKELWGKIKEDDRAGVFAPIVSFDYVLVNKEKAKEYLKAPISPLEDEIINKDEYWTEDNYLVDYDKLPKSLLNQYDIESYKCMPYRKMVRKTNRPFIVEKISYEEKKTLISQWKQSVERRKNER